MKNEININSNDRMWQLYYKSFTLRNRKVENPQNIFRYVEKSLFGFILWVALEIKLWKFWFSSILATFLALVVFSFVHNVSNIIVFFLISTAMMYLHVSYILTLLVSGYRVYHYVMTRSPRVGVVLLVAIGFSMFWFVAANSDLQTALYELKMRLWLTAKVLAVILPIIFGIFAILYFTPINHLQKIHDKVQSFIDYLSVKAKGMYPRVRPPDDFKS